MSGVAAVVVTFNRLSMLKDCIEALKAQTKKIDAIIIINNGSTDETEAWLDSQTDLTIINQSNVGGAGGFHRGMKEAYDRGYDWIWIMDDDVLADPECLNHLLAIKKPIAIPLRIAKKEYFPDLPALEYNLSNPFVTNPRVPINKKLKVNFFKDLPSELKVADLSFEGPMFSREVIEKVGLPESKLFIYFDDTDYGLRCRKHNFDLILVRDAKLFRRIEDVDVINWKYYFKFRNKAYIHLKHGENLLVKMKPIALFLTSVLKDLITFKHNPEKQKYRFWGLIDAYNSNYVKRF